MFSILSWTCPSCLSLSCTLVAGSRAQDLRSWWLSFNILQNPIYWFVLAWYPKHITGTTMNTSDQWSGLKSITHIKHTIPYNRLIMLFGECAYKWTCIVIESSVIICIKQAYLELQTPSKYVFFGYRCMRQKAWLYRVFCLWSLQYVNHGCTYLFLCRLPTLPGPFE